MPSIARRPFAVRSPLLVFVLLALALACIGVRPALAEAPPPLPNAGFEQGEPGAAPPGWAQPTAGLGYVAVTTEDEPAEGSRAATLSYEGEGEPAEPGFGNLMRAFDATPYRGKRVRFSARVRTRGQVFGDRAQLWMRVDREGGGMGFFDNMQDRPIRGSRWRRYEIVGTVADDATSVNVGMMLIGPGRAWIDDASFEVLGAVGEGAEPARPLSERGVENLSALTRLLGYVRFFHPSDGVAEADWDRLALAGVQRVEDAAGPAELARVLEELFRPLAPSVRVYPSSAPEPALAPEVAATPAGAPGETRAWRHLGVGLDGPLDQTIYRSERVCPDDGDPEPVPAESVLRVALGGGVSALVPRVLYVDSEGRTLPRPEEGASGRVTVKEPDKPEAWAPSGADRTTRLAGVVLAWPVFQHFYPYFDAVDADWDAALPRALRAAAEDPDGAAYVETLRRMVATLRDGHGGIVHPNDVVHRPLPIAWRLVEDRLVIVGVGEGAPDGVEVGDVVVAIDGVATEEALARAEAGASAATDAARRARAASTLSAYGEEPVVLTLAGADGERRRVTVPRAEARGEPIPTEPRPEPVAELEPGILYVDLDRVTEEEQAAALERLDGMDAVIFDLRGYPRVSTAALARLTDEPISSAQWHVPVVTLPDGEGVEFDRSGWDVQPVAPRFEGRVVYLTDERAISYAETYLGIVEHYRLGEIVGAPTAGTNGNINPFELPGGYVVYWTGMKVLKHDGSRHHGVGIQPTVPAERTIEGVRAGRDEVLERGLEIARGEGGA